ncbi:MAG TPA: sensor histidine kinase [Candidatus Polarisedimenticolaceae bacterium]|nr:sensor histidine kinase [Candidatus Polarisedimenticolaceae bacterium]
MTRWARFGLISFWAVPAAVATLGMQLVPSRVRPDMTAGEILLIQLALWLPWGLSTLLIFAVGDRFPFERGKVGRALAVHIPLCAIVVVLQILAMTGVEVVSGLREPMPLGSTIAVGVRLWGDLFTVIYCGIVVAHGAIRWSAAYRAQQLAAASLGRDLVEAQLRALQGQLRPHFLFNTLNSIVAMIDRDPEAAQRMIIQLAELLRAALRTADTQEIPLAQELELTRLYVDIEKVRFSDRLEVLWRVDVDPERLVPALVLQPLVENAIVHGIARKSGPGRIVVEVAERDRGLSVRVVDDGVGLSEGRASAPGGIGLANLRARLQRLYGAAGTLELAPCAGGGTEATLLIPRRAI